MLNINLDLELNYKKYDNDDYYRNQFLNIFKLEEYDSNVIETIQDIIYKDLKANKRFISILDNIEKKFHYGNNEINYLLLYSYDLLDVFYNIIKKYYQNTLIDNDFNLIENQLNQ